jgi:hypothetical protein
LISTSITFFNKATLSVYDFPYSNTLTLGQMLFATVALYFMKSTNIISYKDFSFSTAKAVRQLKHMGITAFFFSFSFFFSFFTWLNLVACRCVVIRCCRWPSSSLAWW